MVPLVFASNSPMTRRLSFSFFVFLAACKTESSDGLATSAIKADYTVEVRDRADAPSDLKFQAFLYKDDSSTYVQLSDGDRVVGWTDAAPETTMTRSITGYYADAMGVDRKSATFKLYRADGSTSAGATVGIPPVPAFTTTSLSVPYAGGTGVFDLAWSNPVAAANVHVFVDPCNGISTTTLPTIPDTGSYKITTKDLTVGVPAADTCVKLTVWREVYGSQAPDPALRPESTVKAARIDEVRLTLQPGN